MRTAEAPGATGRSNLPTDEFIEIDAGELTGFAPPTWLRDVGFTAWLLVGVVLFLAGAVWLAVGHLRDRRSGVAAAVIASVFSPPVGGLRATTCPGRRGDPDARSAIVGLGGAGRVPGPVRDHQRDRRPQGPSRGRHEKIEGWLDDLGVNPSTASNATSEASSSATDSVGKLLHGVAAGSKSSRRSSSSSR